MKLAEEKKVILLCSDFDYNESADGPMKGINMSGYHMATFLFSIGSLATADITLRMYSGTADLAETSAIAFRYAYGASTSIFAAAGTTPASGADVLAAEGTVVGATGLVIPYATASAKAAFALVVEVDASDMDVANGENWLTPHITCGSATGLGTMWVVLEPRYTSNRSATALA